MATTLLAQITDLHIGGDDGAQERLVAAVRSVLALRPAPDAVLVTGDLTEHGSAEEFALVAELLSPLQMPVHVLPGNHDGRPEFRATFHVPGTGDEPVRYVVTVGGLRLVVVDTTVPAHDTGRLGAEDLRWLADTLAAEPDAPDDGRHAPPADPHRHRPARRAGDDRCGARPVRGCARGCAAGAPCRVRPRAPRSVRAGVGRAGVLLPEHLPPGKLEIGPGKLELVYEPPAFALHVDLDGQLVTHVQPVVDGL